MTWSEPLWADPKNETDCKSAHSTLISRTHPFFEKRLMSLTSLLSVYITPQCGIRLSMCAGHPNRGRKTMCPTSDLNEAVGAADAPAWASE